MRRRDLEVQALDSSAYSRTRLRCIDKGSCGCDERLVVVDAVVQASNRLAQQRHEHFYKHARASEYAWIEVAARSFASYALVGCHRATLKFVDKWLTLSSLHARLSRPSGVRRTVRQVLCRRLLLRSESCLQAA